MAKTITINGTTSNEFIDSKIELSYTSSIASNNSQVTAKLYYRRNNTGYVTSGSGYFSITIDGNKKSDEKYMEIGTSWVLAMEHSVTVSHESDGTKALAVSATGYLPGTSLSSTSCSDTVDLDPIARVSEPTVSASSVVMGNKVTIYTNRKATSLTHTLTYSFAGATGTIATGVGASYEWTVPDLVSKIPGKTENGCTITCKTYSGSTLVGTDTVPITLKIPAKSQPSASASTVQMGKSVNIYTNRKSTGFTHILTYAIGDASGTIDDDVEGGRTWTPPKSLAAYTGNELSAICTITCKTYNGSLLVGTATTQINLTVPDATVPALSASTVAMGGQITISMPKEADVYTHDLTYSLKESGSSTVAASGTIATGVSSDYPWKIPLSLAAKIPSATKGTITITCKTRFKDSTVVVGTEPASFTVTVPNSSTTRPNVTMTVSAADTPFSGVFVAGNSKAKVAYTATSDYSTIASYKTEIKGKSYSGDSYTSAVLTEAEEITITGTVTDARGYSTTVESTITVIDYARPRIIPGENVNSIVCARCNSDGTIDPGGVYLRIRIGRKYSKVVSGGNQYNYCTLRYWYKTDAQEENEYSGPLLLLTDDADTDFVDVTLPGIVSSNTTAYNIRLIAEDYVGESDVVTITVPTAFATWHVPIGGHGFTLGGYHDPSKYDVFDCFFDAEFQGNVSGKVLGLGELPEIPERADANDYKEAGVYAVKYNYIAETLVNFPYDKAGTLRVWTSNGGSIATDYAYVIQEYVPYNNYCTYRRYVYLSGESWEYGTWKVTGGCDAIISQGTTDGWQWRKYANGTAECWRRVSQKVDIATEWGSIFYGNCEEVTFPFSFYSAPVVNATVESGYGMWLMAWTGTDSAGTTLATKPASLRVARPTAVSAASIIIAYHAIGRWKE